MEVKVKQPEKITNEEPKQETQKELEPQPPAEIQTGHECPACGTKIKEGQKYCSDCGEEFEWEEDEV